MQHNFCIVSLKEIWNYLAGVKAYVSCDVFTTVTRNTLNRSYLHYRVIHKSLRNFRTRLRNNQDRHGRKEYINR